MPRRDHAQVEVAVDLAILTVRDERLQVLVIERRNAPYSGRLALPGGFLRAEEDVPAAAVRELREETNLDASGLHVELVGVYSAPERDPRGRVVSVAYLALAPDLPIPAAGTDAAQAYWRPVADVVDVAGGLAFDHDLILGDAVEQARAQLETTTLATAFCGPTFTIGELRTVYEVVWGTTLDPRNFNRKVLSSGEFVRATGATRKQEIGRPAALYERGTARRLSPPLLRG